ncbi:hypothetical protein ACWF99_27120 [Nocardia sp. NPDC055002]
MTAKVLYVLTGADHCRARCRRDTGQNPASAGPLAAAVLGAL